MITKEQIQQTIDNKTKPVGSLGRLEELAFQICTIFNTLTPEIKNPQVLVFAADHGIAKEGVSAYPQEVTAQMVLNFVSGGAAINVFSKQNQLALKIIDAGVNFDFDASLPIENQKIGYGTHSFLEKAAMTVEQMNDCFLTGRTIVEKTIHEGSNCVGFGEMGIGNTATSSVLMHILTQIPIESCVGSGTGLFNEALDKKINSLKTALTNYKGKHAMEEKLAYFGGFELFQIAGGMLKAYENNLLILVDGFISTTAFLVAQYFNPKIKENAIFCHCSHEKAHQLLLDYLQVKPLLTLEMRLGEGSACALAFPIVQSAVCFINKMASFESAGVSQKTE